MILNKYKFFNTQNQEIEMLPIATFLFDHPEHTKPLTDVIEFWAKEGTQISITRIQRKCMLRYEISNEILEALLRSRIAVRLHDPVRVEVCLEESEARHICEFIRDSAEDNKRDEDKWLLKEALKQTFDMSCMKKEEESETETENRSDDFYITRGHLSYYKGHNEDVVIPTGVKHIVRFAFTHNEHVRSVVFPMGLTEIDESAFRGCLNLKSISLPQTLRQLASCCFQDCRSLYETVIPNSVERVGSGAFAGCSSLVRVTLSENLSYIPDHMFLGCKKLETVRIPDYVDTIDQGSFLGCDALKLAYVPKHTHIEERAFEEHTRIVRI